MVTMVVFQAESDCLTEAEKLVRFLKLIKFIILRRRGEIGRHARLRIWFRKEWRFKSSRRHQLKFFSN
jgi:hypothetical protein